MDPLTQLSLTRQLIDIDSTTGREGEAGAFLSSTLRGLGYHVVEQQVSDARFNVIATLDAPMVVLSTHFDCVPPFFPSRVEGHRLHGRGACDAKGTAVAQISAVERLRAAGETRAGLLFVVGEERGSDGAKAANDIAPASCRFLVNGEPTENHLARATRGAYRARLRATGVTAHSSQPELGESAIDKLIDALMALRSVDWPTDPVLGQTFYTTGIIKGGIAPNVISPEAEAEIMFRTTGDYRELVDLIKTSCGDLVSVESVLVVPPVSMTTVPGFETHVFSFTTDIPFLNRWGAPLLLGPGSVALAHTKDEYVEIDDLYRATDHYAQLVRSLMSRSG